MESSSGLPVVLVSRIDPPAPLAHVTPWPVVVDACLAAAVDSDHTHRAYHRHLYTCAGYHRYPFGIRDRVLALLKLERQRIATDGPSSRYNAEPGLMEVAREAGASAVGTGAAACS